MCSVLWSGSEGYNWYQLQSQTKIVGTLRPNAVFFLLVLPLSLSKLFIAVQSPNLVHQHWGDKETRKCPNNFDWDCSYLENKEHKCLKSLHSSFCILHPACVLLSVCRLHFTPTVYLFYNRLISFLHLLHVREKEKQKQEVSACANDINNQIDWLNYF